MNEIYLDNSATTRPFPEIIDLMGRVQEETYGNPSSLHEKGVTAEQLLGKARRSLAPFFRDREKEIIFTSGGTEANNLAVIGTALRNCRRGKHLITSAVEHPSVLNCFRFLEGQGFRVSYIPVDKNGTLDLDKLERTVDEDTILVSIMHVNNEMGAVQPLQEIGPVIKKRTPDALLHVDAVQSLAKLPLAVDLWQADLVSCSAHKIHGPRGIGCLWIREGTLLQPLLYGGDQERGLRPGTENTPAIAGFGLIIRLMEEKLSKVEKSLMDLKLAFLEHLQDSGIHFFVNGPSPEKGAPHILNLSFPGLKAEVLLHSLEERGIYVSSGSACHSRRLEPSHVLTALGLEREKLDSALRFSFSVENTLAEVKEAAAVTAAAVRELAAFLKK
ncbi:MAG: cysteine desulfurase family protein [Bacillota bacterium]|nr:cysteine desulfurase family protein [Bacillota bacterium]